MANISEMTFYRESFDIFILLKIFALKLFIDLKKMWQFPKRLSKILKYNSTPYILTFSYGVISD